MPTTDRALASTIAAAALLLLAGGCGGSAPTDAGGGGGGGATAASVEVTPGRDTVTALDATAQFSATARDGGGGEVDGASFSWSSVDPAVATVDADGLATAVGVGRVGVVAASGGAADTAVLVVTQEVTSLTVTPDSAVLTQAGDTARFSADPRDANDNAVADAGLSWTVADTSVARVDPAGLVTARASGTVAVTAAAPDGPADTAGVRVSVDAPVVTSVSPDPLVAGQSATIRGRNFSRVAGDNVVDVDGATAAATSATDTEITFTVPTFDCRPAREVGVRVTRAGSASGTTVHRLEPAGAPVGVAVGQQQVITDPADFCLQFEASSSSEAYLVGVQSVAEVPGFTTAAVTAVADSSATASQPAPLALRAVPGGGEALDADPRWERHARAHLRHRLRERREFGSRTGVALRGGDDGGLVAAAVSGSVSAGDTVPIRVPDIDAGSCDSFTEIDAEVRVVGSSGIWVTDVDNPSAGSLDDADVQGMSDQFDAEIFPTAESYFGTLPDGDNNGRAVFVVTREVNRLGGVLGFVSSADLVPRSSCSSSDGGELTYLIAPDPNGEVGSAITTAEVLDGAPRLIAHEFTHIVQLARRVQAGHPFPAVWITEGQATFAEEVQGHAATGRSPGNDYGADVAFNQSGADATDWYDNRFGDLARYFGYESSTSRVTGAPGACSWIDRSWGGGPCLGPRAVYGTPSTLLRWLSDHVGPGYPGGEQGLHRDIVDNDVTGFANLEELTGISKSDMLAQWAAMLWVDDRVSGADARLTLPSWDLPDVFGAVSSTGRLAPRNRAFGSFADTVDVNAASTAYFRVSGAPRPATAVRFRTPGGASLPPETQVWVVRVQ